MLVVVPDVGTGVPPVVLQAVGDSLDCLGRELGKCIVPVRVDLSVARIPGVGAFIFNIAEACKPFLAVQMRVLTVGSLKAKLPL